MKGNMSDLMQQAQKMQADMQKAQEELANAEVQGEAGAGLVSVTMTGRHDVKRVSIDDSCFPKTRKCWRIYWPLPLTMPYERSKLTIGMPWPV